MKVVLVGLSGDVDYARQRLAEVFPGAFIETASREGLQEGSLMSRLSAFRQRKPDVFVIATERLSWQRGQNALSLFGALAGAQRTILIDVHGGWREDTRARLLLKSPARILQEAVSSAAILSRAKRKLRQLEVNIEQASKSARPSLLQSGQPKIIYLRATPGPGTQAGGAASHIKGVIAGLASLGAKVRIISNDALAGLDEDKFALTIIPPEPLGSSRAVFEIHNNSIFTDGAVPLVQADPPDFIYQRYARFGWAGVAASRAVNRPLFLEYNGSEVWVGRHWDRVDKLDLLERYERLNLAAAARIFVVSDVERRNLERVGVPPDKIIVNPNGVDTDTFKPQIGGEQTRHALGVSPDEILAGFVGSFGPWHGVEALAEAIKRIPATVRVRFLLVGAGSLWGQVKESLLAQEQAGRVIFTGAVEHLQVPALLDACDILVSPHVPLADGSEFFGSPTKIFEYMAMGKGMVASRLGQIGEVLSDEKTALLVEPGNVEELCAAILRLVESPGLREQLGAAARLDAIEHHTWTRNAQNVLDAYHAWRRETD